jgi:hypothetical protein
MKYKPTFFLKDTRQGSTAIIGYVYLHGTRFRFPTGHTVKPANWSKVKQRVKGGDTLAPIINDDLDRIAVALGRIIVDLQNAGTLSVEAIREQWEATKVAPVAPLDFIATYEQWIAGQPFTTGTRLNHGKAKNHIRKFASARDFAPSFEAWNPITWRSFASYLQTVAGLTNVSVWSILKSVKAFLASTHERGLHSNESYKMVSQARMVPKGESNTDMAYLTEPELSAVTNLDLSDTPRLAKVRDLFVFLCWTGIRFGDSQAIGPDHRHGDQLRFTTGKNRASVVVPMIPEALRIWEVYNGTLPRISNQKANKFLAEVLQRAGIDAPVTTVRFRGTEKLETTEPKYAAIGMHGAKRTFISLSLSRGVSLEVLAKLTGNTPKTLAIYDVRSQDVAADLLLEAWK